MSQESCLIIFLNPEPSYMATFTIDAKVLYNPIRSPYMKPYFIQNVPEDLSNFYTIVFTIHKTSGTFCVCATYENKQI